MVEDGAAYAAEQSWSTPDQLRERLMAILEGKFPNGILKLALTLRGDVVVLTGAVASEAARAAASRSLLAFDRVYKIDNRLEVTGFLVPAGNADDEELFGRPRVRREGGLPRPTEPPRPRGGESGTKRPGAPGTYMTKSFTGAGPDPRPRPAPQVSPPPMERVVRYPSITSDESIIVGARIEIVVDLAGTPPSAKTGNPVVLHADAGWTTLLIDVLLVSPQLSAIESLAGQVALEEDGTSRPARFRATVSDAAGEDGCVRIDAIFQHGTRFCGTASTSMPLAELAASGQPAPAGNAISVSPVAAGPTMTIRMIDIGQDRLMWNWSSLPPQRSDAAEPVQEIHLPNAAAYAKSLLISCPTFAPDDARRRMRAIGEQIWQLSPAGFRSTYLKMRQMLGAEFPIQFLSDEPHVPWEMMRPTEDELVGADHLFVTHPCARWPIKIAGMTTSLPTGRVETFVPIYAGDGTLPAALRERDWLMQNLAAKQARACKADFIALLESGANQGPVSIVHFAGHGRADSQGRDTGLIMEDGAVTLDDVRQSGVRLGKDCGSLVILNACDAGQAQERLGLVEGWGPSLAHASFGAVLAPLWRIQDEVSADFVTNALTELAKNQASFGEAIARARATTADRSSTAFAYIGYGDVMAQMSPG